MGFLRGLAITAIAIGLLGAAFFLGTTNLGSALLSLGQRTADEKALEISGVNFCPPTTARSHVEHQLRSGTPVRVNTRPDRWSEQIAVNRQETLFAYDQSHGLCELRERTSGELVVTYVPPVHLRSPEWTATTIVARTVAFATPEGPMSVRVRRKP